MKKSLKKLKKVIDNETKVCYYLEKVTENETKSFEKGDAFMTNIKFNGKKFFKFMFFISILFVGAFAENGNITGALVLAMLI